MSGETFGDSERNDRSNEAHETGWESLASEREDNDATTTSWDDLRNVEMATAASAPSEVTTHINTENVVAGTTLERSAHDAQEMKRPVQEMSDDEVILEYLGAMDDLSVGFQKDGDNSLMAWKSNNFTNGALNEVKRDYGEETIDDQANDHYLQRSQELGMANTVIGSLAQIQQGLSEIGKKNDQRLGLEAEIRTLEDKLNEAGFFDRLFSPDRRALKELRAKEDAVEQSMSRMNRVIEGDKASLYETLKAVYGEESDEDNNDSEKENHPENRQVEDQKNQDVFESELYRKFTDGERGEKVERALELYKQLGRGQHGWNRKWHQVS